MLLPRLVYYMSAMELHLAVCGILERRAKANAGRSILAGVSGIDGSGKGFVANRIFQRLLEHDLRAVVLPGDGWLFARMKPYIFPLSELTFVRIALAKQQM